MDIMDTEANQATAAQYFCSSATFSILQAVRVGYDVTSSSVHPAAHTRRLSVFKSDYSDSKINIKIIKSELGKQWNKAEKGKSGELYYQKINDRGTVPVR